MRWASPCSRRSGSECWRARRARSTAGPAPRSTRRAMQVRLDRELVAELVAKAPPSFTLAARNPERALKVGGRDLIFASVGGPAYVMDLDHGRRTGSYAEMCDYLRAGARPEHHPSGGRRPVRADGSSRRHPPSRSLLCRDHPHRQELAAPDLRARPHQRCLGDGSAVARPLARIAGRPAGVHRHHQHQFAAAARRADGRGTDHAGRAWPGQCHHALHPCRRHVAGDARRRAGPAARRGDGGDRPCPDRASGRAGDVWRLHLQCRHALGGAGLRDAGIYAGRTGHRPARAPARRALPLEQCHRRQ